MTSKNTNNYGSNVVPTRWNQIFAKNFTKRFDELGLKQNKLAEVMGVNESSIRNWKKGGLPKGDYLIILAERLKCSIDWLVNNEGPEPDPPVSDKAPETAPVYNKVEELANHMLQVAAPEKQYDPHGGWQPQTEPKDWAMIAKAHAVLTSDSPYCAVLTVNINAFYRALMAEKDAVNIKKQFENTKELLENTKELLQDHKNEMQEMKIRLAALEKKDAPPDAATGQE